MSHDSGRTNRLAHSSSPYLLLHRHNPVDWYPWGEEALERARREDKPIFLSVGYSTCFWCHVMERESFSDESIAALMNAEFVNVKLDREERPDLDEIYMTATQLLTGQGGWPNSVFLTPALEPFFAGTYFPPEDRGGLPSFRNVLLSMADAWRTRRGDVEQQAASLAGAIRHHLGDRPAAASELPGREVVDSAVEGLARSFDPQWGGFGGAPKFPSPSNLLLLEELAASDARAAEMLAGTLDRMARGGIYDQLAGGFHRYATDREWRIPHFEKMLYDNGWLLELYARQHERTGDLQAARVARQTAAFLAAELTSPEGALYSALDAETNGEEGAFYVWSRQDVLAVLGEEDFGFLAPLYGLDGPPFFERTAYVLHLPEPFERQARRRKMDVGQLEREIEPLRRKLLRARGARRRPLVDDKVLVDWNGAAIAGLAEAGRVLRDPELVAQGVRAAEFILREMWDRRRGLLHAWRDGVAHTPALLADYAFFVRGLLALGGASGDGRWLEHARALTEEQVEKLADPDGGFYVAPSGDDLLARSRDIFDGAVPAANGITVLNLLHLAEEDPGGLWRERAEGALRAFAPTMARVPEATRTLAVALARIGPPSELAVTGDGVSSRGSADTGIVTARLEVAADGSFELGLEIADGWHLYAGAQETAEGLSPLPLRIEVEDAEVVGLDVKAPDPMTDDSVTDGGSEVRIYSGRVVAIGSVRVAGPDPRFVVSYQACDDRRCLAPATIVIPIRDAP